MPPFFFFFFFFFFFQNRSLYANSLEGFIPTELGKLVGLAELYVSFFCFFAELEN